MKNHFYAMLSRMKYINRWGLMRNTHHENLSEHSLEVAYIAHCLAIISNKRLGGNVDPNKAAVLAMYHDTTEIITGDLPTPIKYFNKDIKVAYKDIETRAAKKLMSLMPQDFKGEFEEIYFCDDEKLKLIIKAADKLSALIKCIEEINMGNNEFKSAKKSTEQALMSLGLKEAEIFIDEFLPSYYLTLDEQH